LIYGANIGYFSDIAKEKGRFFNLRENIYEKGQKNSQIEEAEPAFYPILSARNSSSDND